VKLAQNGKPHVDIDKEYDITSLLKDQKYYDIGDF
jgi:hypothetical protein